MTVQIVCVGKVKERYFRDAIDEYKKRLGRFCTVREIELPDRAIPDRASKAQEAAVIRQEGGEILSKIGKTDFCIALCVEGKPLASEALAQTLERAMQTHSTVTVVIGGSLGLWSEVKARADVRLSLSAMTLPHQMARLVIAEQVYRAFKIMNHETYHK